MDYRMNISLKGVGFGYSKEDVSETSYCNFSNLFLSERLVPGNDPSIDMLVVLKTDFWRFP